MTAPVIGFVGLTHLGMVSSAAAAARGFPTIVWDPDEDRVEAVRQKRLPVLEPGLDALLERDEERLLVTACAGDLHRCDIVYIATDVPTDETGASDLSVIEARADAALRQLGPDALLVVLCQVPPGFTRRLPLPTERLFYQVETLVFGQAVARALEPERFILGCADPGAPLPAPLTAYLQAFGCPVLPMRYESAELCKIAINGFLAASISMTNALAELSEHLGADWAEIVPALRLDRRIGPFAYLVPGLGIAGGNIERDLATMIRLGQGAGSDIGPVAACLANSRHRRDWVQRVLERALPPPADGWRIGVLGLAYKENTRSTKNSPALALLDGLPNTRVRAYDPAVPDDAVHHPGLLRVSSPLEAALDVDALAIMTPWPEFRELVPAQLAEVMSGRLIIDPYRTLDAQAVRKAGLRYHTLGMPPLG